LEEEPKKKNKEYKIEIDDNNTNDDLMSQIPKMARRGRKKIKY
jgi:hypothetical protein